MSKRAAAVQLTSDNYEEDEKDCDEPGQFEQANEDELKQRIIKKAVRRTAISIADTGSGPFTGLKPMSTSGGAGFSHGSSAGLERSPLSSVTKSDEQSKPASTSYLDLLRALNMGVSQWISNHVEKNPYVDLTPIFRDYEKHLEAIDLKHKPLSCESEGSQESESSSQATGEAEEEDTATGGDEESIQEPVKQIQLASPQDQNFKAKLFYKKADEYVDLGVGNLKVVNSSEQTVQLLMRNDTSIGNVMLNVRLTPEIPMMLNKNNVIVVCPPNPPIGKSEDKDSLTYLIRVKTAHQAQQLYSTIKDNLK